LARGPHDVPDLSPEKAREIFQELQTHQVELEMQNEELRRAQEELIDARDQYADLYDFAPVGYISVSAKGLILEANLAVAAMLEVERGELIGKRLSAFVVDEDQNTLYLHRRHLLEPDCRQTCELRMRKRTGGRFWGRMVSVSAKSAQADGSIFRAALSDITQQKQVEQELTLSSRLLMVANRESSLPALLRQFVDEIQEFTGVAAVGVRLLADDGTIPYEAYNGFAPEFYESESPLSMDTDRCMCINVIAGDLDPTLPFCTEAGSFFSNATTELLATTPPDQKGPTRNACNEAGYESVALVPIRLGKKILGLVHVADPREGQVPCAIVAALERVAVQLGPAIQRLRAEEQLLKINEGLEQRVTERTAVSEQRADQLRALAMELTRAEHRERRRLARILHDHLQQLLVGARFRLESMRKQLDNGQCGTIITEIDGLLFDSLNVSRSLTIQLSPAILHDLGLAPALKWLGKETSAKHALEVEVEADTEAEPDDEDLRVLLFEAVRELLFNVVKHAGANVARVVMRRVGAGVQIDVSDDGAGFDSQETRAGGCSGTGLGLFSIRERLGLLGGRLEVESSVGQGTTVRLSAPMETPASLGSGSERDQAKEDEARQRSQASSGPKEGRRIIHVLLADDQPAVLDGLDALLTGEDDIQVVARAADGQTAVDLARVTRPDVVVMDVSMPGMDGVEATRRITTDLPSAQVIGLSMHKEEDVATKMLEAGATLYLSKDGHAQAFVAAIRAVAAK
jgi:PAS domain S-box-containing protein